MRLLDQTYVDLLLLLVLLLWLFFYQFVYAQTLYLHNRFQFVLALHGLAAVAVSYDRHVRALLIFAVVAQLTHVVLCMQLNVQDDQTVRHQIVNGVELLLAHIMLSARVRVCIVELEILR